MWSKFVYLFYKLFFFWEIFNHKIVFVFWNPEQKAVDHESTTFALLWFSIRVLQQFLTRLVSIFLVEHIFLIDKMFIWLLYIRFFKLPLLLFTKQPNDMHWHYPWDCFVLLGGCFVIHSKFVRQIEGTVRFSNFIFRAKQIYLIYQSHFFLSPVFFLILFALKLISFKTMPFIFAYFFRKTIRTTTTNSICFHLSSTSGNLLSMYEFYWITKFYIKKSLLNIDFLPFFTSKTNSFMKHELVLVEI